MYAKCTFACTSSFEIINDSNPGFIISYQFIGKMMIKNDNKMNPGFESFMISKFDVHANVTVARKWPLYDIITIVELHKL